jgi:hypothetical protein
MRRIFATTATLSLLAGCAGSGEGLDANGQPVTGGPQPLLPELQSIQSQVFTPICTACHAGAAAPLGFRLDAASSFAMLVNTPSVEVPALKRVSPGHPDDSYLIQKLEGHAAVGGQMPLGGPYLTQAKIDVIRQWITNGAQPVALAANASQATRLQAIAPLEDEQLAQPPREILVAADGELDVSLLTAGTVTLRRSGGDGTFGDGNDITVENPEITTRSLNPTVLAIRLPDNAWVADRYQLEIAGRGPVVMTDRAGVAIDGAGTGTPGSNFVLTFTVESAP